MAAERITFDTNFLFYALDVDAGERHKLASTLLDRSLNAKPILLLQTLAELYNAARKRQTIPLDEITTFIADSMRALRVVAFESADLLPAITLQRSHMLQFWDALLITTAVRAGCTVLLSEDGQHGQQFDGLTILNPFILSRAQLDRVFPPV